MNEKKNLIIEYIDEEDCVRVHKEDLYNCEVCEHFNECYEKAQNEEIEFDNYSNDFAKTINYGGYETAEEFWNELLE